MAKAPTKKAASKLAVETITHDATRKNIPTAEYQSVMQKEEPCYIWREALSRSFCCTMGVCWARSVDKAVGSVGFPGAF